MTKCAGAIALGLIVLALAALAPEFLGILIISAIVGGILLGFIKAFGGS